jgi:F0F1-type ATP synthase membrane subunit b/b'
MATTAPKKRAPARKPATRKPAEQTTMDYLEHALEDLKQARQHAEKDVRALIDSAMDRVREISKDLAEEIRKRASQRGD